MPGTRVEVLQPLHGGAAVPRERGFQPLVEVGRPGGLGERPHGDGQVLRRIVVPPDAGVLITQDALYNGVHLFLGEHAFDAWQTVITTLEAPPYETIIPGHGLPRGDGLPEGRAIYDANREYLTVAAKAFAEANGPADLNQRLEAAFPSYGGTTMQGLQDFYLYPGARP